MFYYLRNDNGIIITINNGKISSVYIKNKCLVQNVSGFFNRISRNVRAKNNSTFFFECFTHGAVSTSDIKNLFPFYIIPQYLNDATNPFPAWAILFLVVIVKIGRAS